ncbi:MAG: putative metal-binding motif-containing protein, partial [Alphaproteobacteria bacterium]|nr:putative metal-binding motif-containing protein [Alphaproteobacteria bacterium]
MRWSRIPGLVALLAGCADADLDGYRGADDCDDDDPTVHVGVVEVCNGKDDDCDGHVDEDVAITAWQDRDGDGWGDPGRARRVCTLPPDGVTNDLDCDDLDPRKAPELPEACDGRDNDCDGEVDEGVEVPFYVDADGDGHGVAGGTPSMGCFLPRGHARAADDCDDTDPLAWTDAPERCDGHDNDCDGSVDEDALAELLWADVDGDGYGDPAVRRLGCGAADGVAANGLDCDDGDALLNPDTVEVRGNGVDDDCDGWKDEWAVPGDAADVAGAV